KNALWQNVHKEKAQVLFDRMNNYTDHLGNVRLSYTQDPQTGALAILEEQHYYPFGLQHKNYRAERQKTARWAVLANEPACRAGITKIDREEALKTLKEAAPPTVPLQNPGYMYKFQTKELQDELGLNWYDFGLRQYDPALGRMLQIDPVTHHSQSPYTAFDNNPVFWSDPDGADTVDPIKDKTTVISSYVDKSNNTFITQTTTNTTTTTNDDGSVSVSYSSASITNKVDAEGNVTKGTSVTQSSGTISKNTDGKISTTAGKTTTREAKSGDASSALGQWTNTVSSYNKSSENGIYNIDKINKTADYTTTAGKAGVSVLGTFAGFDGIFSMLSTNTKALLGVVGGVKGSDSLMGTIGGGLKETVGANNKYMIIYGVQHVQNGAMMKEMKTPAGQTGGSRYSVGPTSWQGLWKAIKNIF
ncbi:MAG: hypothetical protein CO068_13065, partial [Flavobacteriaceae bacterium CG_4_9_14_0_8_um_filter_34_30]